MLTKLALSTYFHRLPLVSQLDDAQTQPTLEEWFLSALWGYFPFRTFIHRSTNCHSDLYQVAKMLETSFWKSECIWEFDKKTKLQPMSVQKKSLDKLISYGYTRSSDMDRNIICLISVSCDGLSFNIFSFVNDTSIPFISQNVSSFITWIWSVYNHSSVFSIWSVWQTAGSQSVFAEYWKNEWEAG